VKLHKKEIVSLLENEGVVFHATEAPYGIYKGRQVRVLPHLSLIELGDNCFDRWANSREDEIKYSDKTLVKQFRKLTSKI